MNEIPPIRSQTFNDMRVYSRLQVQSESSARCNVLICYEQWLLILVLGGVKREVCVYLVMFIHNCDISCNSDS